MTLEISDTQRTRLTPFLRKHLLAAHRLLKPALTELSIALVDDATIARLHWQFMRLRGPTDVLTFELDHDNESRVTSGEVVVCVPYARRSAKKDGVLLRHELLLYCLHGMLHLCGYDDRTQSGFNRMHRKEDEILEKIGIGPVFKSGRAKSLSLKRRSKGTLR